VEVAGYNRNINGITIKVLNQKNPDVIPWEGIDVEQIFELPGLFRRYSHPEKNLIAGAKHVILSVANEDPDIKTELYGVNRFRTPMPDIISTGNCTANRVGPVAEFMAGRVGIQKAVLTAVRADTSGQ
jgi:glyceraldehyde 3-phosphate dehydrogenase